MGKLVEKVVIQVAVEKVYNAYFDINGWKNVLSDVTDVEVIRDEPEYQEFYMSVIKQGLKEKVHTVRICKPFEEIRLEQPTPPPQVKFMSGNWKFEAYEGTKTLVTAERVYEVKNNIDEISYTKNLQKGLKRNLLHFKNYLEGIGIIEVERVMDTSIETAVNLFWDIENWNKIWNPIIKTSCSFDNNYMQEFTMCVERDGAIEHIEGVQIKNKKSIQFYNTICPHKLKVHHGNWNFEKAGDKVLVTAVRVFKMEESNFHEFTAYKRNLQLRIINILECFQEYFSMR